MASLSVVLGALIAYSCRILETRVCRLQLSVEDESMHICIWVAFLADYQ